MKANQVYELINQVQSDALGNTAVRVRDTSTLVSLGETILSSETNTDNFYKKLCDRIGMTYVKYRRYVADNKDSIMRTPLNFGIVLQKVQTKSMCGAKENGSWSNQVNPFAKERDTTDIMQSLFTVFGTWETDTKLIYDYQLRTAFEDITKMSAFVNLIYNDMANAMEFQIEQCIKTTKARMIAEAVKSDKALQHRNLLNEFNTKFSKELTVVECLTDVDFLKFASREIYLGTKRIGRMTSLFNSIGADRFTPVDKMELNILADFSTATATYLEADTYHRELIALPKYKEVDSWQSSGTAYDFEDVSKINVSLGEDDENPTEQSGILAVLYDTDACGIMVDRLRTKSMYNAFSEVDNVVTKMDYASFCDVSENAVVFYVAE